MPNITQKGVDLRIGLDIARLSLNLKAHADMILDAALNPARAKAIAQK